MTVEVLRLSDLEADDALKAAEKLLDLRGGGPLRLRRLLVLDDADRLVEHERAYHRLETGRRVADTLCVAAGPLAAADGTLALPESLGGSQGMGVIWVGDELGVDWRFAAPFADGHAGGRVSGLGYLVELLQDDDLFTRVHEAFRERIPGKVASPGLWLAGADAEDETFAAALALSVSRITQPGQGTAGPFAGLLPSAAGGASLAPGGRLARDRNEVAEWSAAAGKALEKSGGLGRLFGRGDGGARGHAIEAGVVLGGLRDRVSHLLRDANANPGDGPTAHQHQLIQAAGIQFPPAPAAGTGGAEAESLVYREVAEAIEGGDTLPFVAGRLQATERGLERRGSASYLPEVELRCPQQLLDRLANPPQRQVRQAAGGAHDEIPLDDARRAADALAELVIAVANVEWSPLAPSAAEASRVRIALSTMTKALPAASAAGADGKTGSGARRAWVSSHADSLRPVLCALVLRVVAAAGNARGATGMQSRTAASELAGRLLRQWNEHVHAHGMSDAPPFAAEYGIEVAPLEMNESGAAEIRDAVAYGAEREMWQLCMPGDLDALDLSAPPSAVRFAPRQNREALAGTVPLETVWTSSGSYAGLLRLIPLQDSFVTARWHVADRDDQPGAR
jgi:hypothetical protein